MQNFRSLKLCGMALAWLLAALLSQPAVSAPAVETAKPPLEIGVLPYVSLSEIIKAYGPLAAWLEQQLGRTVRIVTGRDYPDFIEHTAHKSYPLAVTGSHFARMAQLDQGYAPLLRPLTNYQVLLLVPQGAAIAKVADLRGKRIAVPGTLAQTTILGRVMLKAHGLDVDRDVQIEDAGNHKNALLAVLLGKADACFVSEGAFRHINAADRQGLREIGANIPEARPSAIPVILAASPDLPAEEREKLASLISRFANETSEGQAWINGLQYQGLRPPTAEELQALDTDVQELRQALDSAGRRD